jgi:hypothetical protein
MSTPPGEYYAEERWNNWLDRLREEEIDPESDDAARLFFNLLDDATIAIAKIVTDYEDGELDEADAAVEELARIREIVLSEVEIDDEEKLTLVDGIQTSLVCAFYTAEEFIVGGPAAEGTVEEHLRAAAAAEDEEDLDTALAHCVQAGTLIVDGEDLPMEVAEGIEYGLVADWINGLDSLGRALADPEVVEEDE